MVNVPYSKIDKIKENQLTALIYLKIHLVLPRDGVTFSERTPFVWVDRSGYFSN